MSTSSSGPDIGTPALSQLPWAFIDCPTDTLVVLITHMLNLLIQHNDQVILTPDALTRFHSRAPPGISVIEYLRRIVKYTNMEKIPLLSLLSYIDITCTHLPTFTLSSLTVHRFLIAGVCAGSKAQCDVFCTNSHYAKVGGIRVEELNALEREFLKVTQWELCCTSDLLQRYYTSLIRSHGGFTQASAPDQLPFRAFPRSTSKPPDAIAKAAEADGPVEAAAAAEEEEEDDGMEQDSEDDDESEGHAEVGGRNTAEDEELGGSASGAETLPAGRDRAKGHKGGETSRPEEWTGTPTGPEMGEPPRGARSMGTVESQPLPDRAAHQRSPSDRAPHSAPGAVGPSATRRPSDAMDVDEEEEISSATVPFTTSDPAFTSAAQVPDSPDSRHSRRSRISRASRGSSSSIPSSRSSVRGVASGQSSSFAVRDAEVASPRIDRSHANGEGAGWGMMPGDEAGPGAGGVETTGAGQTGVSAERGTAGRHAAGGEASGRVMTEEGDRPALLSGPDEMTTSSADVLAGSEGATNGTGDGHTHSYGSGPVTGHHAHAHAHGGKLLKHLVGGIFGRKTSHHAATTPARSDSPPAHMASASGNGSANGQLQQILRSRPLSSPALAAPHTASAHGFALPSGSGEHDDRRLRTTSSPVKLSDRGAVTPRVRSREERSADGSLAGPGAGRDERGQPDGAGARPGEAGGQRSAFSGWRRSSPAADAAW